LYEELKNGSIKSTRRARFILGSNGFLFRYKRPNSPLESCLYWDDSIKVARFERRFGKRINSGNPYTNSDSWFAEDLGIARFAFEAAGYKVEFPEQNTLAQSKLNGNSVSPAPSVDKPR